MYDFFCVLGELLNYFFLVTKNIFFFSLCYNVYYRVLGRWFRVEENMRSYGGVVGC